MERIGQAAEDGSLKAPMLTSLIAAPKRSGGTCHLLGLVLPGGVHSHQIAHVLTDGRDPLLPAMMHRGETAKARALLDRRLHRRPSPRDARWRGLLAA